MGEGGPAEHSRPSEDKGGRTGDDVRAPIDSSDLDYFASWLKWDVPGAGPDSPPPPLAPVDGVDDRAEEGLIDMIADAESIRLKDSDPPEAGAPAPSTDGAGTRAFRQAETPRPGGMSVLSGPQSRAKRAKAVDAAAPVGGNTNVAESLDGVGEVLEKLGEEGSPGAYGAARRRPSKTPPPLGAGTTSPQSAGDGGDDEGRAPFPDAAASIDPRRPIEPTARAAWDAGRRSGLAEAVLEVQRLIDSGSHRIVDLFRLDERLQALASPIDPDKDGSRH